LRDHLAAAVEERWWASFPEIEGILGFSLPRSAYAYPAWWSNDATGHSHSLTWQDAGWKAEQVDLQNRQVTFRKTGDEEPRRPTRRRAGGTLHGAIPGIIQMVASTGLSKPTGGRSAAQGRIMSADVLLDTCALLWLVERAEFAADALERVDGAAREGNLWISPMSAREVGVLSTNGLLVLSMPVKI
jgi:hypothetical protein